MSNSEHKKSTPIDFVTAFFNLEKTGFSILFPAWKKIA